MITKKRPLIGGPGDAGSGSLGHGFCVREDGKTAWERGFSVVQVRFGLRCCCERLHVPEMGQDNVLIVVAANRSVRSV